MKRLIASTSLVCLILASTACGNDAGNTENKNKRDEGVYTVTLEASFVDQPKNQAVIRGTYHYGGRKTSFRSDGGKYSTTVDVIGLKRATITANSSSPIRCRVKVTVNGKVVGDEKDGGKNHVRCTYKP